MGMFRAIEIANTSLGMHQTWLDALAHNISNVNTITSTDEDAFQGQLVVAQARADGGVEVADVEFTDAEGRLVYAPEHPLADADGNVRAPDMDMGNQMSALIMAQRGYQASIQVTKSAQETYTSAIGIGRA